MKLGNIRSDIGRTSSSSRPIGGRDAGALQTHGRHVRHAAGTIQGPRASLSALSLDRKTNKKKHNKTNRTKVQNLKKTNNTKFNPIINEVSNEQNPVKII